MRKIGLTGTIASGKTTAGILLRRKGFAVFDCDGYSRILYQKTNPCYAKVADAFGEKILDTFGEIDRVKLAAIIFSDPEKRRLLNSIVHPAIVEGMRRFFARHESEPFAFAEVPLLFEANLQQEFDETLVISCHKDAAIRRMIEDRNYTEEEAIARYEAQMNREEKEALADHVIYNDGTIKELDEAMNQYLEALEGRL